MLFNLKSIVLYGLLSVAAATPIFDINEGVSTGHLEARMAKKKTPSQDYKSLSGQVIPASAIAAALSQARKHVTDGTTTGRDGNGYPKHFGNRAANTGVATTLFPEKGTGANSGLMEYPLVRK